MKYIVAIIAFAALSNAEIFNRPCRTPEQLGVKTNFDVQSYLRDWYEIERYEQMFQATADCVRARYSLNDDGSVRVFNSAYVIGNNTLIQAIGTARVSFPDESPLRAMLNVTFDAAQPNLSNYWVLSTDYTNYAFVVSCFNLPENRSSESYWLLSRTKVISAASRIRADVLISAFIDKSRIRTTNQDDSVCRRPAK